MNTKYRLGIVLLTIILIGTVFVGKRLVKDKEHKYSMQFYSMGTFIKLTVYDKKGEEHLDNMRELIEAYELVFSAKLGNSELNRLNSNVGKSKVSDNLYELLEEGIYFSQYSKGAFDITIKPLTDLWQIGTSKERVPEQSEIEQALSLVDYTKIQLEADNMVTLNSTQIELGAIAKGYVADKLREYVKNNSIEAAIIDIGGNILTVGKKPSAEKWQVGVREPIIGSSKILCSLDTEATSVVTSGAYERYFEADGNIYHHILNTATGYPAITDILSVTVVCDNSTRADAYSTILFVLGLEKGMELVEKDTEVSAIFVTKDKEIYVVGDIDVKDCLDGYRLIK